MGSRELIQHHVYFPFTCCTSMKLVDKIKFSVQPCCLLLGCLIFRIIFQKWQHTEIVASFIHYYNEKKSVRLNSHSHLISWNASKLSRKSFLKMPNLNHAGGQFSPSHALHSKGCVCTYIGIFLCWSFGVFVNYDIYFIQERDKYLD
jgi:hypothetical protein